MFNTNYTNFMNHLAQVETNEFLKKFERTTHKTEENFLDGNVLFRTVQNRTSFQNLLTRSKVVTNRSIETIPNTKCYKALFNDVANDIVTFNSPMDFNTTIQTINKIQKGLGTKFYGALLISDSDKTIKLNPLHPLTAMSLINDDILVKQQWVVAIFVYGDRAALDNHYKTSAADTAIIEENIKSLLNCYSNRVESFEKITKYAISDDRASIRVEYKLEKHADEDSNSESMLVAHQFLTGGILIPYYGVSILKMAGGTSGHNVTPMISSNIRNDKTYESGMGYDSKQQADSKNPPQIKYNAVCTGSQNNKTLKGLRTLTHSNTLSPFNRDLIVDGALAYVDACNVKSLEIYKLAGIVKGE